MNRVLDERRGPVQSGDVLNAFGLEGRLQLVQRALDRLRHFQRVGAVLAGHCQQNARLAHDERVAKFRFRRFDDVRHVFQSDAATVMLRHDDFAELRGGKRLAFRLN